MRLPTMKGVDKFDAASCIRRLQMLSHDGAVLAGLWGGSPGVREVTRLTVGDALLGLADVDGCLVSFRDYEKVTADQLAELIVRLCDLAGGLGLDLEPAFARIFAD